MGQELPILKLFSKTSAVQSIMIQTTLSDFCYCQMATDLRQIFSVTNTLARFALCLIQGPRQREAKGDLVSLEFGGSEKRTEIKIDDLLLISRHSGIKILTRTQFNVSLMNNGARAFLSPKFYKNSQMSPPLAVNFLALLVWRCSE